LKEEKLNVNASGSYIIELSIQAFKPERRFFPNSASAYRKSAFLQPGAVGAASV
jgi:hypothetical protein